MGGGALVVAGFVLALLALAMPWAHFRLAVDVPVQGRDLDHSGGIAVFQLELGWWYVLALFAVLGLVAGAAAATGGAARGAGVAALAVSVIGMLLASLVGRGPPARRWTRWSAASRWSTSARHEAPEWGTASRRRWCWRSVAPCCRSAPSKTDAYPGCGLRQEVRDADDAARYAETRVVMLSTLEKESL
ncbi:hypothetical protein GCM10023170_044210 [Phytohabitans houttuyneae]|uniref:Uncharacterized protein n=1 Tax=Phytohabitans houttuyneae TaxID=1076126 RepID=A0A6V8K469_9ACTN|nr:hypothetical protein Phou_041430 [Phytohabitans houttuyneae]